MVAFYGRVREPRDPIVTREVVVLSTVGRDLCEKFFRGYTRKQWGLDLSGSSTLVLPGVFRFAQIPMITISAIHSRTCRRKDSPRMFARDARPLRHPRTTKVLIFLIFVNAQRGTTFSIPGQSTNTSTIDSVASHTGLRFEHQHLAGVEHFQAGWNRSIIQMNLPSTRISEIQVHDWAKAYRHFHCSRISRR